MDPNETAAPAAEGPSLPAATEAVSVRDAASIMSQWRQKQFERPATEEKPAQERTPKGQFAPKQEQESTAPAEDAAPPQEATGEIEEADPAETPPLERPRSWAREREEAWNRLDRDTQEYLLEHDRTTSSEVRKAQNDAAERTKALEAKEQAAEQARQQYEQAANRTLEVLQGELAKDFGDIKTTADLQKLAQEDPFRFIQYQARRDALAEQARNVETLRVQRETEAKGKFETWAKEQDEKFDSQFKEFKDPEKGKKLREGLKSYLVSEVGIPERALPELWNNPIFRDALTQRLVYDAYRFNQASKTAKAAVAQPKPPVLKPGTTTTRADSLAQQVSAAQERLKTSRGINSIQAAADFMKARRAQSARR